MSNNSSEIQSYFETYSSQSSDGKMWSVLFCSIITALILVGNLLVIVAFISRPSLRQVRSNIFIFSLGKLKRFILKCRDLTSNQTEAR